MNDTSASRLNVCIELGRAQLESIPDQEIQVGTTVILDQTVDEPVHVFADKTLVARGEIVIIDNRFCVRITDIIAHVDAIV